MLKWSQNMSGTLELHQGCNQDGWTTVHGQSNNFCTFNNTTDSARYAKLCTLPVAMRKFMLFIFVCLSPGPVQVHWLCLCYRPVQVHWLCVYDMGQYRSIDCVYNICEYRSITWKGSMITYIKVQWFWRCKTTDGVHTSPAIRQYC